MIYFLVEIHMENQTNGGGQNTQQIEQNSVSNPVGNPQVQNIQSQPAVTQNITPEIPKKSKKWILLLLIFLIIALGSIVGVYAGIFRLPTLNQQKLEVLPEQKEKNQVNRPTKDELVQAFQKANNEVVNLSVPVNKIVDFIYPVFYPPEGYKYSNIQVTVSEYPREEDRCKDDFCKKLWGDRELREGYKVIYVHFVGQYDGFQDEFLLGLKYSPSPSKKEIPSAITLNGLPESVSSNLANKIDIELENNAKVKSFKKKYSITQGIYSFYRSGIKEINSKHPSQDLILGTGLPDDKDWIVARYVEPKFGIPELPKASLAVYIDPTTYQVVQVK